VFHASEDFGFGVFCIFYVLKFESSWNTCGRKVVWGFAAAREKVPELGCRKNNRAAQWGPLGQTSGLVRLTKAKEQRMKNFMATAAIVIGSLALFGVIAQPLAAQ
jgi:hypothetical protein